MQDLFINNLNRNMQKEIENYARNRKLLNIIYFIVLVILLIVALK